MASNNQGIAHISTKGSGNLPLCGNRSAIVSVDYRKWLEGMTDKYCKRCEAKAVKVKAITDKRNSRIVCA